MMFWEVLPCAGGTSFEEYLTQGDQAYEQKDLKGASQAYENALKLNPKDYETTWKLSRTYSDFIGLNRKELENYYIKSVDLARKAIELNSEGSKGHLYLSIALGRMTQIKGSPKERIRLSKEIKAEAQRAVDLDPKEHLAWHILGCWNRELATLSWIERKFADVFLGGIPKDASLEKAVACFKKAIEVNPVVIIHHLELAVTYERLDQKTLAIDEYQKVLELPVYHSEDEAHKKTAEGRLRKLKK
jgi:tetratricopeptide (TPR) repeat protein